MKDNSRTTTCAFWAFLFVALISAFSVAFAAWFRGQPQVLPVISRMEVYANKAWQDTGIEVSASDIITIQYVSGRWHLWPGQDTYDGSGFGGDPTCDCNVLMYVSHGGLIGRIENGTPFYVGNAYEALALQIGKLYLRTNDVVLSDNSGSITVNIEVKQ